MINGINSLSLHLCVSAVDAFFLSEPGFGGIFGIYVMNSQNILIAEMRRRAVNPINHTNPPKSRFRQMLPSHI